MCFGFLPEPCCWHTFEPTGHGRGTADRKPGTTCKGERLSHRVRTRERDSVAARNRGKSFIEALNAEISYYIYQVTHTQRSLQPCIPTSLQVAVEGRSGWRKDLAATPSAWHPLWEAADHGGSENRVGKMRLAQCHAESVPLAT
jgi:hypothetical protein